MEFYYQPNLPSSGSFPLEAEESFHAIKTRRRRSGDRIHLTNGQGEIAEVEIIKADAKACWVKIISHERPPSLKPQIRLAVSPLKQETRFEWLVEKAVEIGVSEIIPILCERTEQAHPKFQRLERLMVAAMKQSLKAKLPVLQASIKFKDFISTATTSTCLIAHCEPNDRAIIGPDLISENITLLIGPEGDFSTQEIEMAIQMGAKAVSFGENRLRTETAALVGLSQIHHAYLSKS